MLSRATELVRALALSPHPEGGYFREVYRSESVVQRVDARDRRAAVTAIYFLLAAGEHSGWHRVASDEVWHFHEGDPLELYLASPGLDRVVRAVLGPALDTDGPIHVVPANWWQAARPRGAYTLAGCTVAPGFEFADFVMLRDQPELVQRLLAVDAGLAELL